jgi:hypothetical protein
VSQSWSFIGDGLLVDEDDFAETAECWHFRTVSSISIRGGDQVQVDQGYIIGYSSYLRRLHIFIFNGPDDDSVDCRNVVDFFIVSIKTSAVNFASRRSY